MNDPKRRHIHKASVRDRLLHHAIYRILYPFFDKTFVTDSFSCRLDKGTQKAINRLQTMFYKVSLNNTHACWVLKCDIRKFFANIDHNVLLNILTVFRKYIVKSWNIFKKISFWCRLFGLGKFFHSPYSSQNN